MVEVIYFLLSYLFFFFIIFYIRILHYFTILCTFSNSNIRILHFDILSKRRCSLFYFSHQHSKLFLLLASILFSSYPIYEFLILFVSFCLSSSLPHSLSLSLYPLSLSLSLSLSPSSSLSNFRQIMKERHSVELRDYQRLLMGKQTRPKFSKDLLNLRKIQDTLAKQKE